MKRIEIKIGGASYPCYQTAGAMLRFKDLTGKEVTEIKGVSDLIRFLWCCAASACAREKRDFPFELIDFADNISETDLSGWGEVMNEEKKEQSKDQGKKKKLG